MIQRFGAVDAVVNNASIFEHDSVKSFGYESLLTHMRTNTGAPVLLAQALHEHVCQTGRRRAWSSICSTRSCGTRIRIS